MPGPMPDPDAVRRNAPTIPTTKLPAAGRQGRTPRLPATVKLGEAGTAWWKWAWRTPQAAGWSTGDLYTVARRAGVEDDLAALELATDGPALEELLELADNVTGAAQLAWLIRNLRALAGNRAAVLKAANDLDDRLGLSPKGMANLRWKIVDETEERAGRPPGRPRRSLKAA